MYAGVGSTILVFVLLNFLIYRFSRDRVNERMTKALWDRLKKKEVSLSPSPTPTPYPIAQGKQIYNVNTNNKSGPKIGKVTIDPLDTKIGETQTIDVTVKSTNIVSNVMVALRTDKNVLTNHNLALNSDTATDGVWSGAWKSEFIHDYLYQFIITATDMETSNSTTVTIR